MEAKGYGQYIRGQIQSRSAKKPITTIAVAASLADVFAIGTEKAKKITNVNMKRLVDKGELVRIQKGVYGKTRVTPFGKLNPRPDEMLTELLLRDGEKTIGYIAGPTLLNALGLCSLIPADRHIATNRYRRRFPEGTHIRVYKPILSVNDENARYLQALEAFSAMERYPVDAENPDDILRDMVREGNINNETLIRYAHRNCGQKTLLKTIDVTLGGTY
jgi:predicted transcriptional regulator of viral defense system